MSSHRAVGCIFGELLRHRPLLPGSTESSQLALICALLGSPNEKIWPGFTALAAGSLDGTSLPAHPYNSLSHEFPALSEAGLDLLSRLLTYDPSKRITASKALHHAYFTTAPLPCPEARMPTFPQSSASMMSDGIAAAADAAAALAAANAAIPVHAPAAASVTIQPPVASDASVLDTAASRKRTHAATGDSSLEDGAVNKRGKIAP
jgi:serine/threonine protein kinase